MRQRRTTCGRPPAIIAEHANLLAQADSNETPDPSGPGAPDLGAPDTSRAATSVVQERVESDARQAALVEQRDQARQRADRRRLVVVMLRRVVQHDDRAVGERPGDDQPTSCTPARRAPRTVVRLVWPSGGRK